MKKAKYEKEDVRRQVLEYRRRRSSRAAEPSSSSPFPLIPSFIPHPFLPVLHRRALPPRPVRAPERYSLPVWDMAYHQMQGFQYLAAWKSGTLWREFAAYLPTTRRSTISKRP